MTALVPEVAPASAPPAPKPSLFRANRTNHSEPERATTVAVAIASYADEDGSVFGISCEDLKVAVRCADEQRSELHNLIDAFEFLVLHPHFADKPIDLLVSNESFAAAIGTLLGAWPRINVVNVGSDGYLMKKAYRAAERLLTLERTPDADDASIPDSDSGNTRGEATAKTNTWIVCATDGSAGGGRCRAAAYGWFTERGDYGSGVVSSGAARVAELAAIAELLANMPTNRKLRVLVDCEEVLRLVASLQRLVRNDMPFDHLLEEWNRTYLFRMATSLKRQKIVFEKVRAHAGHPLNETADRLARYARRVHQMKVTKDVADPVFSRIVAEGVWAWSETLTPAAAS